MHKKYVSNQEFKHLVMPMMMTGVEPARAESMRLSKNDLNGSKKKRGCC